MHALERELVYNQPSSGPTNKRAGTADRRQTACNANPIGGKVKPIKIPPYQGRTLKDLYRSANQGEEENQVRFAFRPSEAPNKCQRDEAVA
ncbi:hypothetical protein NKH70_29490 [Mesorhizobium sp. M0991]|uniref:hypothetical protein n=1 Tax=Mesorhizobium sp. M0991 TaxID=2957043 RepID=UPI0033391829